MEEEADVGPALVVVVGAAAGAGAGGRTLLEDDGDGLGVRGAVLARRDGLVVPLERDRGGRGAERDGVRGDGERDLDERARVVEEDGARRRGAEPEREAAVLGRTGVRDRREGGTQRRAQRKSKQGTGHWCWFLLFLLGGRT